MVMPYTWYVTSVATIQEFVTSGDDLLARTRESVAVGHDRESVAVGHDREFVVGGHDTGVWGCWP